MRPAFLSLLALLAPLFVGAAAGQPVQPLDRVLPQVQRTHPGQFYDADGPHPGAGGSQHYHLKWMTPDGRIVWYDTDARTGRVLGASPGRDNFDPAGQGRYGGQYRQGYDGPPPGDVPRGRQDYGPRDYGSRGYGPRDYGGRGYGGGFGGQNRFNRGDGRGYDRGGNGHRGR